jgi:hypothetical protein
MEVMGQRDFTQQQVWLTAAEVLVGVAMVGMAETAETAEMAGGVALGGKL